MKFGAEPKKTAILGVLLAVAAIVLYTQVFSGPSDEPSSRRASPIAQQIVPATATASPTRRRIGASNSEFRPRVGVANPKDRPDPATIDPQIRFDLLAKLEKVDVESTGRNIFQMGSAPIPIALQPGGPLKPLPKSVQTIAINHPPATAPPVAGPVTPQAPPITFHYYGFKISKASGRKEAFLLDGDEILIAGENETVERGRYKVTHIGVNSITIEDTQFNHSQTLQLEEVTG